ncbi:hypothetical protein V490_03737 [Pseudogymnoascus sp. VKM F-3557]|nr:hypothetical protein V490_03737 [Pseudogymnoascus sp. VKM F-3557]
MAVRKGREEDIEGLEEGARDPVSCELDDKGPEEFESPRGNELVCFIKDHSKESCQVKISPLDMAAAFGFSCGDFIAAVELVTTVVNALSESSEATQEYSELLRQLYSLNIALLQVKSLHVGDSQHSELVGIRQAAAQCHQTIDAFWQKIQKYQPHLQSNGSSSRVKDSWMKIKWAVCKKDEVAKFKADLAGHTESILMLLAAVQIEGANIAKDTQELHNKTLFTTLQAGYTKCLERISSSVDQGKLLLRIAVKVLRTNLQIFQAVVAIQTMMANAPSQIERQQPVYLIDALGKYSPFHLEFIRSAEALTAVLMSNFKGLGEQAVRKIEKGRFVIQDSATKRDIDLSAHWDTCFHSGQRAEMSIIFIDRKHHSYALCPKCEKECIHSGGINVDCLSCGAKFSRIEDDKLSIEDLEAETGLHLIGPAEPKRRSVRLLDLFQRVRIIAAPLKLEPAPSTASTDNLSTGLSSESDETDDVNRLIQRQEEALFLSHPSPVSNGKRVRLWQCCNCGEAGQTDCS